SADVAFAIREAATILVQLIAPMMPHLAEECWQVLGQTGLISEANWPQIERDLLVEDNVTLVVQVNGKKRGDVTVPRAAQNPDIEAAVLALDAVKSALGGKAVVKVTVFPRGFVIVVGKGPHCCPATSGRPARGAGGGLLPADVCRPYRRLARPAREADGRGPPAGRKTK